MHLFSPPSSAESSCQNPQLLKLEQLEHSLRCLHQMDQSDTVKRAASHSRDNGQSIPSSPFFALPKHDPEDLYELQLFEPWDMQHLKLCQFTPPSSMDSSRSFPNPFLGVPPGSVLDPASNRFSAREWLYNLIGFISKEPERYTYQTGNISVCFSDLDVYGFGSPTDYQKTVGNVWLEIGRLFRYWIGNGKQKVQILKGFDGVLTRGEMLLVLGRPGSGCTTLLKTISGHTRGFFIDKNSIINYQGIPSKQMHEQFRGETMYMAENDVHFPQLTVGQTLMFAAKARAPRDFTFPGITRVRFAECMVEVIMATFGLRHTVNTKVGLISGGEKKRVSIAEAALSGSPLQCWDNSTRGLDSANALEFCRNLRLSADMAGATIFVSLYQGSQNTYEVFDKVTLLYEGKQIFFGPCHEAQAYFINMGFECVPRQTTADFLTSLTSSTERRIRPGFETRTPRTPDEFVVMWQQSSSYAKLRHEIRDYQANYPFGGRSVLDFTASRRSRQAKLQYINFAASVLNPANFHRHVKSPYTLSIPQQIGLCVDRGFQRLKGDASVTISSVIANSVLALIVGSIFYNLQEDTGSFYSRSVLIFFSILLNAFASALEIIILYDQRPITEKHAKYALCHPFTEAAASAIVDLPFKLANSICFNIVLYFMTNLRRTSGAFFTFLAFSFCITLSLSMVFRTIGASSRTLARALAPAAIFILSLMVYTGFVIPLHNMVPWFRWINYIDPIAYAFESLMINEFDGRQFDCSTFVPSGPSYSDVGAFNHICAVVGAVPGMNVVSGTNYLKLSFNYERAHLWRNMFVIIGIFVFSTCTYLAATEFITAKKSKGEVLLYPRQHRPALRNLEDIERPLQSLTSNRTSTVSKRVSAAIHKQTSVFHWRDICYDIKIQKEARRILNHVDGWVKPGTLTALMGPSGAGKTTLLDVLATRDTVGVASGRAHVDGHERDISFQRKTGYAQQQDFHLETATVREALRFNALMCQSNTIPKKEKLAYVEKVIKLLGMSYYADAVVGVPGEGLNIEQRKKLTIAVEIAARPKLLLFLDEPTSGLDSQTSWAIMDLLEKLTDHGQGILCTIHQPSAMLFQRFDRLLLLAPEGKPIYFGNIGPNAVIVIDYFERNGATPCPLNVNPADWVMEVLECAPGHRSNIDWHAIWLGSPEYARIHHELDRLELQPRPTPTRGDSIDVLDYREFAATFHAQLWECFKRVNSKYWRTPSYIYSKAALSILASLFIGFSFYQADNSLQGLQNQIFSIFMLLTQSSNLVPQILPNFVAQRTLYEARERSAKTYSWQVFILSNILVELPWNTLMSICIFSSWYFPVGLYRNADIPHVVAETSGTVFLLMWAYMMYMSTFAHMIQAGVELAGMAGNYANLLFMLTLIFCGILVHPDALPGFWTFMYRVSPFTYLVGAVLSVGLANAHVRCADIELLYFDPAPGTKCDAYMKSFMQKATGYLTNPEAMSNCAYCSLDTADGFLRSFGIKYEDRWRNFGIMWVFVATNVAGAFFLYWLVRVPKRSTRMNGATSEVPSSISIEDLVNGQDYELAKVQAKRREIIDEGVFVHSVPVSRDGKIPDCGL